jgi:hypothetical protein
MLAKMYVYSYVVIEKVILVMNIPDKIWKESFEEEVKQAIKF